MHLAEDLNDHHSSITSPWKLDAAKNLGIEHVDRALRSVVVVVKEKGGKALTWESTRWAGEIRVCRK
jgi:hypothetical protein